jgi:hypothetical protein
MALLFGLSFSSFSQVSEAGHCLCSAGSLDHVVVATRVFFSISHELLYIVDDKKQCRLILVVAEYAAAAVSRSVPNVWLKRGFSVSETD